MTIKIGVTDKKPVFRAELGRVDRVLKQVGIEQVLPAVQLRRNVKVSCWGLGDCLPPNSCHVPSALRSLRKTMKVDSYTDRKRPAV